MEVLWDLDTEAMDAAAEAGLRAVRTPTPGVDPVFVAGLVDLVQERLSGTPAARAPARDGPRTVVRRLPARRAARTCAPGSSRPRPASHPEPRRHPTSPARGAAASVLVPLALPRIEPMRIHIATDHAGLEFSTQLQHHLAAAGSRSRRPRPARLRPARRLPGVLHPRRPGGRPRSGCRHRGARHRVRRFGQRRADRGEQGARRPRRPGRGASPRPSSRASTTTRT